jgi:hypothetical protein
VLKINNRAPKDLRHFYDLLRFAGRTGVATLLIHRDEQAQQDLKQMVNEIPKERQEKIQIRDGWTYKVSMSARGNQSECFSV